MQNVLQLFLEAENANLLNEDLYKTWVSGKLAMILFSFFSSHFARRSYMYYALKFTIVEYVHFK